MQQRKTGRWDVRMAAEAGTGPGGATLDTVIADQSGDMVLLESTTRHG